MSKLTEKAEEQITRLEKLRAVGLKFMAICLERGETPNPNGVARLLFQDEQLTMWRLALGVSRESGYEAAVVAVGKYITENFAEKPEMTVMELAFLMARKEGGWFLAQEIEAAL